MELPEQLSKRPVREHLTMTTSEQETWFENANHKLQACIYDPATDPCHSGRLRKVTFTKEETSWTAGRVSWTFCSDSAHNTPLKDDARNKARAS